MSNHFRDLWMNSRFICLNFIAGAGDFSILINGVFHCHPLSTIAHFIPASGQLTCPKPQCSAKLGHFNWVGQPCPCGHWVVPAFHLAASKVDKCVIEPPNASIGVKIVGGSDDKKPLATSENEANAKTNPDNDGENDSSATVAVS